MVIILVLALMLSIQFGWAIDKELPGLTILFGVEVVLFALIMHNVQF